MIGFSRFLAWVYLVCSIIMALVVITNYGRPQEVAVGIGIGLFMQGLTIFCLLMLVAKIAENTQQPIGATLTSEGVESIDAERNKVTTNEALHNAVWNGDYAEARQLILGGADVNHIRADGKSPLDLAVERGDKLIVQLLNNYGVKPSV
jgi:hypothetical protein